MAVLQWMGVTGAVLTHSYSQIEKVGMPGML